MRERVHIHYSGKVQGVGFRWRIADAASGLPVTGFVRNRSDGRVELVAEGERAEVERFLATVRERFTGFISREDASWQAASGEFPVFAILR